MKVIQVVPSIGAESSGPSYSVPALCRGLTHVACEVELCFGGQRPNRAFDFVTSCFDISNFPHPSAGRSPGLLNHLRQACRGADIIHSNGLWMFANVYPEWARKGTRCRHVLQPRGTLSKWALAHSKWRKFIFGHCFQYDVLAKADMFVATAESEYEEIRALGYRQPICILPNGVDLPVINPTWRKDKVGTGRRMFFLSRIHPKKNVEMLITIWARLEKDFPEWSLSIVGPDKENPYADEMKALSSRLGCHRVRFEGELKGEEKYRFITQSDCMVLPTHSENFGMVVAEALACGVPTICSHGAPWAGLQTNRCGWWVPTEEAAFELAMRTAMRLPSSELEEMGGDGIAWMRRDFDWNTIGEKMKTAYEWLCNGGERPDWVKI